MGVLDVDVANYQGRIFCMFQGHNGSTMAAGAFDLHSGVGEFSKALQVNIGGLRGAELVSPTGSTVGSATFA